MFRFLYRKELKEIEEIKGRLLAQENANKMIQRFSQEETQKKLLFEHLKEFKPNYVFLSQRSDADKDNVGAMCSFVANNQYFDLLDEDLKRQNVERMLFGGTEYSDDYLRGTINGVYVFSQEIKDLAAAYDQKTKKGLQT